MPSNSCPDVYDAFRKELFDWARTNLRSFPWREDPTPYEVLVAEILLTQTPASRVNQMYNRFLDAYPSLDALGDANIDDLINWLQPLGFQNRRANALKQIGEELRDESIPQDSEELMELPYVGRYGANATLCFGFGERRPIVDANVIRIYNRVFNTEFRTMEDDAAWDFSYKMLPKKRYQTFNLALVDFGALVCTAQNPSDETCPMNEFCDRYITKHS